MFSLFLLPVLLTVVSAIVPPAISAPTATPAPVAANIEGPGPTLAARCETPPCSGSGGPASTLSASVVTSTILSTTSVPCYITTYVTGTTTTTSTVYSTETITSTVTQDGTVFIYHFSPTPVLRSSVYESIISITETKTSVWLETEGSEWESTSTGSTSTYGGAVGNATSSACCGEKATNQTHPVKANAGPLDSMRPGPPGSQSAAHEAVGMATIAPGGMKPVPTASSGWVTGAAPPAGGAQAGAGPNGAAVSWSGADHVVEPRTMMAMLVAVMVTAVFANAIDLPIP